MKFTSQNSNGLLRILGFSLLLFNWIVAQPVIYNNYDTIESEIERIESLQRNARQLPPSDTASEVQDLLVAGNEHQTNHGKGGINEDKSDSANEQGFFKTYQSDANKLKDYVNETFGKTDHGYKKRDRFDKRDKDNYAFKNYAEFGRGKDEKKTNHHDQKKAQTVKQNDHEGSGTSIESHYINDSESYLQGDGEGDEYYSGGDDGQYEGSDEPYANLYSDVEQYSSAEGSDESKQYSGESAGYYSDY